ncbi:hypothetical protein [Methylobacterium radiotolerans]|uniref:hypothetical protein n=1 Tax=Methylobacterium radiotolerans TaxID=31998 RepID=UPI0038D1233C
MRVVSHIRNSVARPAALSALAVLYCIVDTRSLVAGDFFIPDFLIDITDIHDQTTRTSARFGSQQTSGMMQYPSTVLVAAKGISFVEHSATCSDPLPAQYNFQQDKSQFQDKVVYDIHPTVTAKKAEFSVRCESYKGSYKLTYKTDSLEDVSGATVVFEQRLEGRSRGGENQTEVVSGRFKLRSAATSSAPRKLDYGAAIPCEYETQLVSVTADDAGRTLSRHTRKFTMTGSSKCIMRQLPK